MQRAAMIVHAGLYWVCEWTSSHEAFPTLLIQEEQAGKLRLACRVPCRFGQA